MGKNHTTKQINDNANEYFAKEKIYDALEAQNKLGIKSYTAYVEADAFIGNPYSLLGRVMMIRRKNEKCPESLADKGFVTELAPLPISGVQVDDESKIDQPIKRGSLVVSKELSTKVGFLSYLSSQLTVNSKFSIIVFDQLTGLVDVQAPSWPLGLNQWISNNTYLLQDPDVCYLYAIVGIVQKNVIRKKYTKLDAKAGGGAYGINIDGEIHTSNEEYFLDMRFGLTPVLLKSSTFTIKLPRKDLVKKMNLIDELKKPTTSFIDYSIKHGKTLSYSLPNEDELNIFSTIKKFA